MVHSSSLSLDILGMWYGCYNFVYFGYMDVPGVLQLCFKLPHLAPSRILSSAEFQPASNLHCFSYFLTSDQKTSFTKCFQLLPRSPKLVFKTGNGIFQTGNGFTSLTSWAPIKKILYKMLQLHFDFIQSSFRLHKDIF